MTATAPFRPPFRLGIDVGGTFTDLVLADADGRLLVRKAPSTPAAPERGVLDAIALAAAALGTDPAGLLAATGSIVHGSTVATNAVLEGRLARIGLLCTAGFRDTLAIRRGIRNDPWDHRTPWPDPLVPRRLRRAVRGRIGPAGEEWETLDEADVLAAAATLREADVEAVAIGFLNAPANPAHERRAADLVRAALGDHPAARFVLASSSVLPILGEYERIATVAMHAALAPRIARYLEALERSLAALGLAHRLLLVQSNGGACTVAQASARPANLVLSGPAAGVAALRSVGTEAGEEGVVLIEIGGTSCDVTLMRGGEVDLADTLEIAGHPLALPAVAIHTVGAGGGTIAGVDAAGLLFAGPQGAGARPGPACYGLGGSEPTVTDAQAVLGRLAAGPFAGGALSLDPALAEAAIARRIAAPLGLSVEQAASGILRLVTQQVAHAVEEITLRRGVDPRRFALVAGGGAGPMLAADVARRLGMRRVVVPRLAGAFCAFGMLNADLRLDRTSPVDSPIEEAGSLARLAETLAASAQEELAREGFDRATHTVRREAALRYRGQHWTLPVPLGAAEAMRRDFEAEHLARYGHIQPGGAIEARAISVSVFARLPRLAPEPAPAAARASGERDVWFEGVGWTSTPVVRGVPPRRLAGPAILDLDTSTVVIPPFAAAETLACGDLMLSIEP
ncbi:MAG: hydantoinase/oxoprolinase family protein [Acetobacteraceae bacterium]